VTEDKSSKKKAVPSRRLTRFSKMVQLAGGVAGSMVAEGAKQLSQGKRPKIRDLLLTPKNARRVADQLANLRGAAMKLGQLLSMDGGDFLPPELADILARLRSNAESMPTKQLVKVLQNAWGEDWQDNFSRFDMDPVAAASIGQVHKAVTRDGRTLALKIQYPGVRKSIDSDVENVATLLRISTLLPKELEIDELLEEAKVQLHQEADYIREAKYLKKYGEHLAGAENFLIPEVDDELTTKDILAMTFIDGHPIEQLVHENEATRNRVMTLLLDLLFKEIFEFQLVQTDPNFANYQYNVEHQSLVLLDFGATRQYKKRFSNAYKALFKAAIKEDMAGMRKACERIGYFKEDINDQHLEFVQNLFFMATEPLRYEGEYDFANTDLGARLNEAGMELSLAQGYWHTPPMDSLFLHRKLGGLFLLAARLKSKVNVNALAQQYLS
jgi:predicted unusual protein kinase regulating ubiquinone biosynthesis (AarF/ABC1/UbiB family)